MHTIRLTTLLLVLTVASACSANHQWDNNFTGINAAPGTAMPLDD